MAEGTGRATSPSSGMSRLGDGILGIIPAHIKPVSISELPELCRYCASSKVVVYHQRVQKDMKDAVRGINTDGLPCPICSAEEFVTVVQFRRAVKMDALHDAASTPLRCRNLRMADFIQRECEDDSGLKVPVDDSGRVASQGYMSNFATHVAVGIGYTMGGKPGTGKTMMSHIIAEHP